MAFTVADSGGTGTSLAFYENEEQIRYVETRALHPKFLLNWGEDELAGIRAELPGDLSAPLFFYGAGCSQPGVAYEVKLRLQKIGFSNVTVFPDTLGACRACCGNTPGLVAILGTGSVLLEYSGSEIVKVTGGLGGLAGDEGSGFFFGRLLLNRLFSGKLTREIAEKVTAITGSEMLIRARLASPEAIQFISGLAGQLAAIELEEVHSENISAFMHAHLENYAGRTVHFVGSYAWFQRDRIRCMLGERGFETGVVLRNPISQLVKYHAGFL